MTLTGWLLSTAVVVISIVVGVGYKKIFKAKDDNPVEEMCEKIVKDKTGIDVDFTPETKEKNESNS